MSRRAKAKYFLPVSAYLDRKSFSPPAKKDNIVLRNMSGAFRFCNLFETEIIRQTYRLVEVFKR